MAHSSEDNDVNLLVATKIYLAAQFTKRDLILYALGIGCGSGGCGSGCFARGTHYGDDFEADHDSDRELRYVYEENLEVFPSFLLALSFVAEREYHQRLDDGIQSTHTPLTSSIGIRSFPPESMIYHHEDGTKSGLLPRHLFLGRDIDLQHAQKLPILHVSQSLILHNEITLTTNEQHSSIDPPTYLRLETKIVSVEPRNKGTFVTSETTYHQFGKCIATAQMVALIVGIDRNLVVPFKASPKVSAHTFELSGKTMNTRGSATLVNGINRRISNEMRTVVRYRIPRNAALLYRLSGDYNPIHVKAKLLESDIDTPANDCKMKSTRRRPVLHGLCTLGYALRGVLRHIDKPQPNNDNTRSQTKLTSFRCSFVKPVFVNDALCVEVWDDVNKNFVRFCVYRELPQSDNVEKKVESRVMVLDGTAEFCCMRSGEDFVRSMSRI